ncbi:hypothetical protein Hanom_Chr04g00377091 [Helianthus anomalus]
MAQREVQLASIVEDKLLGHPQLQLPPPQQQEINNRRLKPNLPRRYLIAGISAIPSILHIILAKLFVIELITLLVHVVYSFCHFHSYLLKIAPMIPTFTKWFHH